MSCYLFLFGAGEEKEHLKFQDKTYYYILAVTVDTAEVRDRAEVKSQHSAKTAGSVNLDFGANNQD